MLTMLRSAALALLTAFLAITPARAMEIEGVKFEPTVQVGGATLQLNGAGIRTRAIFKVYVAGLYVPAKSTSADALLAQKGPRRVAITMLRSVDAKTFASSLDEGLRNNASEAQLAGWKAQIEALNAALIAIGGTKSGDKIDFDFAPDAGGTRVMVNGQPKGAAIPGEDFFTAVLRIWIGEKPADSSLKKGMLGG